jgi:transcription elongation GreA/GreB family factor
MNRLRNYPKKVERKELKLENKSTFHESNLCLLNFGSMTKQAILQLSLEKVNHRMKELEVLLDELHASMEDETKSSAGDKHETARAMVQLEQEKLSKQLNEFVHMKGILTQINPTVKHLQVGMGSLVETSEGWYFLSVGLGQISIDDKRVFALNPQAPIGQQLKGKKVGDEVAFGGRKMIVLSVF